MLYGYMRVSTQDQTDNLQRDALQRAGIAEFPDPAAQIVVLDVAGMMQV